MRSIVFFLRLRTTLINENKEGKHFEFRRDLKEAISRFKTPREKVNFSFKKLTIKNIVKMFPIYIKSDLFQKFYIEFHI